MKLKNILGLAVCLVGTGVFASCDDFFDLNPKDQLTTNTFWNTSEDVDAAVTAAYIGGSITMLDRSLSSTKTAIRISASIIRMLLT